MTADTTSLPEYRGGAGETSPGTADPASAVPGSGWAPAGVGEASDPPAARLLGAAVDPFALVAAFLDAAIEAELLSLRARVASLAAEYESLRDPLLGAPLIDASRPARALRGLLGEAGA